MVFTFVEPRNIHLRNTIYKMRNMRNSAFYDFVESTNGISKTRWDSEFVQMTLWRRWTLIWALSNEEISERWNEKTR